MIPAATFDWLDRNIAFRLGALGAKSFYIELDAPAESLRQAPFLYAIDGQARRFMDWNGILGQIDAKDDYWFQRTVEYPWSIGRSCAFMNYFCRLPFRCDLLLNMADAQSVAYGNVLTQLATPPVFQFSRLRASRDVILFPLQNYMEVGSPSFQIVASTRSRGSERRPK